MPPKIKVTKQDIVKAAMDVIRESGEQNLNARAVAAKLKCSTQPVFSNYDSMEQLKSDVISETYVLFERYTQREIASGKYPIYKASGIAYIRFAGEEKELFKLLFMCERSRQNQGADETWNNTIGLVQQTTGLDKERAERFHLDMWVVVHGIATMVATSYLDWDFDLISQVMTDTFIGIIHRFGLDSEREKFDENN
ncbi:MAG: WHG domain-containing protein [Faecalibacterium sp.]|nr:WHG domain-containing protein [Ruminococcus sp.]MCM1391370.1 WHG domain-containing protein [Ruminococcus sp.]MCM1484580.1 WHG domain-containing protein [Faecalibacterium sp.]